MSKFAIKSIVISVVLTVTAALAHEGATGVVKTRMDGFKQSQQDFKALIKAARDGDYEMAASLSQSLEQWGLSMPEYFPAGSNMPPSEAADTIWSDPDGFAAAVENYVNAASAINTAALAEDKSAIMAAIKMTSDSCSSCHKSYRVK